MKRSTNPAYCAILFGIILMCTSVAEARWYDPYVGRFVSRDPVDLVGGDDYTLSHNNPERWPDWTGLEPVVTIGSQPCDLKYSRCPAPNREIKECNCSCKKLKDQFRNTEEKIGHAQKCIASGDPNNPSCKVFDPPPGATCDQARDTGAGITVGGIPYYNPNHPKADKCSYKCTCEHENVHVGQTPGMSKPEKELPAYQTSRDCLKEVIENLPGCKI